MPKPIPLPDQDRLLAMFRYDPATGEIYWRNAGRAFTTITAGGYRQQRIDGVLYYAHRVIWKMVHNTEPPQIDHDNRTRSDNRLDNLKDATALSNAKNVNLRRDSKSGEKGVCYLPRTRRWRAYIQGRHIGYFPDKAAAIAAREIENEAAGFSASQKGMNNGN